MQVVWRKWAIRERMEKMGLSDQRLADQIGVVRETVNRAINGSDVPTSVTVVAAAILEFECFAEMVEIKDWEPSPKDDGQSSRRPAPKMQVPTLINAG